MSRYPTPDAVEAAFYKALEDSDLETMMSLWEASEDIICIHPLGSRLQGVDAVRQSWQQIFHSGAQMRFRISALHVVTDRNLTVRVVYENITLLGAEQQPQQPVIATNIFRLGQDGWHMILHHASPGARAASAKSTLH